MISLKIKEQSAADDTFQNLFLSIVKTPVPADTSRITSYIYKILMNDIIDETRKSDVYRQFVHGYREFCDYKTMQEDPETEAIELEETQRMFQSIRRNLPAHQAEAVIQTCVLGNNTGDAARKMALKPRTFAKYLYKGKRKLRRLFGKKREKQGDGNELVQEQV
jgi:RNA polymerase sigma factor (sigma-70 family)